MNLVHATQIYANIHFNIIAPSTSRSSRWALSYKNPIGIPHLLYACYMSFQSHIPCPSQFIINKSSLQWTLFSLNYWKRNKMRLGTIARSFEVPRCRDMCILDAKAGLSIKGALWRTDSDVGRCRHVVRYHSNLSPPLIAIQLFKPSQRNAMHYETVPRASAVWCRHITRAYVAPDPRWESSMSSRRFGETNCFHHHKS
jgi:hypothetical protein